MISTSCSPFFQIGYLLDCVRNSVETSNGKLPCIITVFLISVMEVFLQPDHVMYSVLNSFILLKPNIDVLNIPEFYKLFNSSALEVSVSNFS